MKRVFLIDDDIDDRDHFRSALKMLDTQVDYIEAQDGQEALDMMSKPDFVAPDIIFVDLNMPRVNGYEFVIRMKQLAKFTDVPAYIYTTCNSPREKINCVAAGASGYIMKQIKPADLARELAPLISEQRMSA